MNGGGNGGSDVLRGQQRLNEQRVSSGMNLINSIYDGGVYGTNPVTDWGKGMDLSKLFTSSGDEIGALDMSNKDFKDWATRNKVFVDQPHGGHRTQYPNIDPVADVLFGHGDDVPAITLDQARQRYAHHLEEGGMLYGGKATASGFTDSFFNQRAKDYENFALPTLAGQAKQTQDSLAYKLANQGLLKSSIGSGLATNLQGEITRQKQGIADQGTNLSNALRQNVEQQRSSLVAQLQSSSDPAAAGASALRTASGFSAPSAFAPLGNLFQNWSNLYLANQASQPTSSGGAPGQFGYNSPLYYNPSANSPSSRIVQL